ncbi:MAG TPA: hypothetical protein VHB51_01345 [Candidatus Saccharimonadales bacterium]|nr:hypothetical protein [Candidatus Saccharimonadales bacterium]
MPAPAKSESPFPYHPEVWRSINALSVAVLAEQDIHSDPAGGPAVVDTTWRLIGLGFACRLERPLLIPDDETIYTLAFENDQKGMRNLRGQTAFIAAGDRRPAKHRPYDYGILKYCQAQGLIEEPEGVLPDRYIRTIGKISDPGDPKKRIRGFENLIKDLLEPASRGNKPAL